MILQKKKKKKSVVQASLTKEVMKNTLVSEVILYFRYKNNVIKSKVWDSPQLEGVKVVDVSTKQEFDPGETWSDHDDDQAHSIFMQMETEGHVTRTGNVTWPK